MNILTNAYSLSSYDFPSLFAFTTDLRLQSRLVPKRSPRTVRWLCPVLGQPSWVCENALAPALCGTVGVTVPIRSGSPHGASAGRSPLPDV